MKALLSSECDVVDPSLSTSRANEYMWEIATWQPKPSSASGAQNQCCTEMEYTAVRIVNGQIDTIPVSVWNEPPIVLGRIIQRTVLVEYGGLKGISVDVGKPSDGTF